MRKTLKTRQMKKTRSRKNIRTHGFREIESTSLPVIKPEVMVKTSSVLHKIHSQSNKRVAIAVLGDVDVDGDIYKFQKKGLLADFKKNQSFREAVMSGAYFYHQGRICLYHPDVFVGSEQGIKIADVVDKKPRDYLLSHYARHISVNRTTKHKALRACRRQCRVPGKINRDNNSDSKNLYCVEVNHARKYSRKDYRDGNKYSEAVQCSIELVQGFINGGQGSGPNDTFGEFFTNLMTERKLTIKQLADKTDIPERTITRMRSEEGYKPSIEYLLACCIVMKLPPWDSDMLFELAGIVLRPNNKKERCYIALLHVFFKEGSISVCDEVLTMMGLPSLSSIISSNKKNK